MNKKTLLISSVIAFMFSYSILGATVLGRYAKPRGNIKWRYIIIHHSATKRGCAKIFDKYHKSRGMKNGMAYHFVIDNGTCGKRDGQLEIGSRWKKQISAGGCRQARYNNLGIHVCLVGNFTKKPPSRKQLRTLAKLVNELRNRYNIPMKFVVGHGRIKGEKSQCPGRRFPWRDFKSLLKRVR